MQLRRNMLTMTIVAILALVPLGQAGLVAAVGNAAPQPAPLTGPTVIYTITSVGAVPTGVAVDEEHNYIYVASRSGNHLTRINGENWGKAYSATSGVVYAPMGLAVNPADQRVYACNGSQHLSIVNGQTLTLIKAVDMGSGNTQMDVALHTALGYAFATDFYHERAYAVNMSTYAKSNITNIAPGGAKIALSPDGKAAYVSCYTSNAVDVFDTARRELVARYFGHYNKPVGIAVNPFNGYIYVANSGNGTLTVVDDRNVLKQTITVAGSGAVKGVAYNPNTNHIFVTRNGNPGYIYAYDGSTYGLIWSASLGKDPDAYIAVDKTRNRVYVTNLGSNSVSVIQDAVTAAAATPPDGPAPEPPASPPDQPSALPCPYLINDTVGVGAGPQGIAVDDVHGVAYVANGTANTISRLDLATNTVLGTSPSVLLAGPTAAAVDPTTQRVYVANSLSPWVTVFDGPTLSWLAYVQLPQYPQHIYLVPELYRAYVTNHSSDSSVNYVSELYLPPPPGSPAKLRDFTVGKGPYAVALSADRLVAYVSCRNSSAYGGSYLSVIDITQGKEVGQFFTHYNQPTDIVLDPVRDRIYVANEGSGAIVAVDHRNLLRSSIVLGNQPRGLALNPAFHRLAILHKGFGMVSFLDTSSFTPICSPILTQSADRWIAFSASRNRFYASRPTYNAIAVIQDYIGDGYEPDDAYSQAKFILNDIPQIHSIDPAGDVDWVKFNVSQPMTLTMSTTDTNPAVYTTTLSLYDTNGTTVLVANTNPIVYAFTTNGVYYLKVNATDPAVGNANYTYQLRITGGLPSYSVYLPLVSRTEQD